MEQILGNDLQTRLRLLDLSQIRVLGQNRVKDLQEVLERVLVKWVDLVEDVHGEVDAGAGLGECQVLVDNCFDLFHDLVGFGDLAADFGRL